MDALQHAFEQLVAGMAAVLFFNIGGFPFIVLWLLIAAVFFTIYLRGVNFRLLGHAIDIARGKYDNKDDHGEVSHLSALLSALAGTVGLGSIAGVSVAVAVGGPGVIFWILVCGLLGMATKFAEVTLSMCYRKIDVDGKVLGGPFHYLREGLKEKNMAGFGKFLAVLFAIFCLGGALGGGNMFQSNQAVKVLTGTFAALAEAKVILSLILAVMVGLVLVGSIKRIAKVADVITPMKGIAYLICAVIIIVANLSALPDTIAIIFSEAFSGKAAAGGFIAMLALAFKRASFANEAGLGSAPIAHSAARTTEPVREGVIALLEPFFAAIIGVLTGLIVVITGAYAGAGAEDGVMIASKAYSSVGEWFTVLLAINVMIFAYSTMIAWSYYGEMAWTFLFGRKSVRVYQIIFCTATFLGGVMNFGVVLDFSDLLILGCALPNLIAVYILRARIKTEMEKYTLKLKTGVFG